MHVIELQTKCASVHGSSRNSDATLLQNNCNTITACALQQQSMMPMRRHSVNSCATQNMLSIVCESRTAPLMIINIECFRRWGTRSKHSCGIINAIMCGWPVMLALAADSTNIAKPALLTQQCMPEVACLILCSYGPCG
eukprot:UN4410